MYETIGNQQPSLCPKLGWLGGIIDGEGCLQLAKQSYRNRFHFRPQLVIGNTNPDMIDEIVRIANENNLPVYVMSRNYAAKNSKCKYDVIQIMGLLRVKKWLDAITPYLIAKKEQAQIISEFIEHRNSLPLHSPTGEKDMELKERLNHANRQYKA